MSKWTRYFMGALLLGFIVFLFYTGVDERKSAEDVYRDMVKNVTVKTLEGKGRRELLRYYSINSVDVDSFVLYMADNSLDAEELLILKAEDTAQLREIQELVEARRKSRLDSFRDYDETQAALLEHAVIRTRGDFLLYAVGEDAKDIGDAFSKAVR